MTVFLIVYQHQWLPCRLRMSVPLSCLWVISMAMPSSRVVGFYDHEPSWSCCLCLRNSLWLRSVGCDQLVVGPTHARGGILDLLMTDVPYLVRVAVVAPIGNSDHSSLSPVISMAQAVPNLCVSRKAFLKHQVNWNTICGAIQELPWRNIWLSDNSVEVLNKYLSLLVGRYVPTNVIRVCNARATLDKQSCVITPTFVYHD